MPALRAAPLPAFTGRRRQSAPVPRMCSGVSSVEPSSTTSTALAVASARWMTLTQASPVL